MTRAPLQLRFDAAAIARKVAIAGAGIALLCFALDLAINWAEGSSVQAIRRLFNTAREDSLPSWFGIMQTAAVAATVWLIWLAMRASGSRRQRSGWLALTLFFSYLAFDDGAHIHERVGTMWEELVEGGDGVLGAWSSIFPSYEWQFVFMPAFAAMGLFTLVFLLRELRGAAPKAVLFCALALLAGAVTLDFFEGLDAGHPLNPYTTIAERWQFEHWTQRAFNATEWETLQHFSRSVEECVEMFAFTLLWSVFIGHLGHAWRDVRVRFDAGEAAPATVTAPRTARPVARAA